MLFLCWLSHCLETSLIMLWGLKQRDLASPSNQHKSPGNCSAPPFKHSCMTSGVWKRSSGPYSYESVCMHRFSTCNQIMFSDLKTHMDISLHLCSLMAALPNHCELQMLFWGFCYCVLYWWISVFLNNLIRSMIRGTPVSNVQPSCMLQSCHCITYCGTFGKQKCKQS